MTYLIAVASVATLCPFAGADEAEKNAIDKLNSARKFAGLNPVTLDEGLSKACRAHADYLVKNADAPSAQGLGAHTEDPKLPGYTEEGARAAKASNFTYRDPVSSMNWFIASLFHRIPLLNPHLRKVGIGVAKGGKYGWVCIVDVGSGCVAGKPYDVVIYPVNKQTDVPTEFCRYELPRPFPDDPQKLAGFPVTATFDPSKRVTEVVASLKDGAGQDVEVWLSTPEQPADAGHQRNTVGLIAKEPLKPGASYTVSIRCKIDKKAWSKTWSFTTRR